MPDDALDDTPADGPSDTRVRIGAVLAGRYELSRTLGAGGMGTVYLAEDLRHRRPVAVKVLRPEVAATLGAASFLREAEVAATLQHPNVLPLLDSGETDGVLFYVMPYVPGESLRQRLAREGKLPIADTVRVLREVVDALAYAHAQGVVHRDLKPENVLLSGRRAMVADFGIAKALQESTDAHARAHDVTSAEPDPIATGGLALGTPAYMAPEQVAGDAAVDQRADVYAVGVLAFELLTGRPPFVGRTAQEVLAAHVTRAPEPVGELRPEVPPALAMLVMRCLAARPTDRWQRVEEMLPILETLATPTHGVTPVKAPRVATPHGKRRRLRALITVLVLLVALALLLGGR